VTVSGEAEWPEVADAVIEAGKGAQHAQEQLGVAGVIEGKYTVSYN